MKCFFKQLKLAKRGMRICVTLLIPWFITWHVTLTVFSVVIKKIRSIFLKLLIKGHKVGDRFVCKSRIVRSINLLLGIYSSKRITVPNKIKNLVVCLKLSQSLRIQIIKYFVYFFRNCLPILNTRYYCYGTLTSAENKTSAQSASCPAGGWCQNNKFMRDVVRQRTDLSAWRSHLPERFQRVITTEAVQFYINI